MAEKKLLNGSKENESFSTAKARSKFELCSVEGQSMIMQLKLALICKKKNIILIMIARILLIAKFSKKYSACYIL